MKHFLKLALTGMVLILSVNQVLCQENISPDTQYIHGNYELSKSSTGLSPDQFVSIRIKYDGYAQRLSKKDSCLIRFELIEMKQIRDLEKRVIKEVIFVLSAYDELDREFLRRKFIFKNHNDLILTGGSMLDGGAVQYNSLAFYYSSPIRANIEDSICNLEYEGIYGEIKIVSILFNDGSLVGL